MGSYLVGFSLLFSSAVAVAGDTHSPSVGSPLEETFLDPSQTILRIERRPAALSPVSPSSTAVKEAAGAPNRKTASDVRDAAKIVFVLYATENAELGKNAVGFLKQFQDTLVVPVTPLNRANFSTVVRETRLRFVENWLPVPSQVDVTVIAPESAEGTIRSDEALWPLTSLKERDEEILSIFRGQVDRPNWNLLLSVPPKKRCQLGLSETIGLKRPRPRPWNRAALEQLLVPISLLLSAPFSPAKTIPASSPHVPDAYVCSEASPTSGGDTESHTSPTF